MKCKKGIILFVILTMISSCWDVLLLQNIRLGVKKYAAVTERYYDAILMDVRMPVMNGMEATQAIRAMEKGDAKTIPIIALTANAYESDIQSCLEAGMNAHLAKPVDKQKLYDTLAEMIKEDD